VALLQGKHKIIILQGATLKIDEKTVFGKSKLSFFDHIVCRRESISFELEITQGFFPWGLG